MLLSIERKVQPKSVAACIRPLSSRRLQLQPPRQLALVPARVRHDCMLRKPIPSGLQAGRSRSQSRKGRPQGLSVRRHLVWSGAAHLDNGNEDHKEAEKGACISGSKAARNSGVERFLSGAVNSCYSPLYPFCSYWSRLSRHSPIHVSGNMGMELPFCAKSGS